MFKHKRGGSGGGSLACRVHALHSPGAFLCTGNGPELEIEAPKDSCLHRILCAVNIPLY